MAILILYGTVAAVALQEPAPRQTQVERIASPPLITPGISMPNPSQIVAPPLPIAHVPSVFQREQSMSYTQLMKRWEPLIKKAAKRFAVPSSWIRAVMRIESGGRTMIAENARIVSSQGALGLMQIQPGTYAEMRALYGLGRDPFDPHDNVFAATAYLRWLRGKYGYPTMFEAYNEGPGNLEQRMTKGQMLPAETRNYASVIMVALGEKPPAAGVVPMPGNAMNPPASAASTPRLIDLPTSCAFTRPDGSVLVVDCSQVTSVRASPLENSAPQTESIITIGSEDQGVRENEEVAKQLVRTHGGHI